MVTGPEAGDSRDDNDGVDREDARDILTVGQKKSLNASTVTELDAAKRFGEAWPPAAGLTSILVPRASIILALHARINIKASPQLIWTVLRDTSRYPNWNTFCPAVSIHESSEEGDRAMLAQGTSFTLGVVMKSSRPEKKTDTRCRVTDVSTPQKPSEYVSRSCLDGQGSEVFSADLDRTWRIAWTTEGGFVARGLRSERFSEIISLDNGSCEYRTWECQGGMLAKTVKWLYEQTLQEKFDLWCTDLRAECERQAKL